MSSALLAIVTPILLEWLPLPERSNIAHQNMFVIDNVEVFKFHDSFGTWYKYK